jgi:hypoxanthine phosphoribosyltransferase
VQCNDAVPNATIERPMTTVRLATPADDIAEILVDERAIADKVRELGASIADDYRGKDLVLVSILKGALPFLADLMRQIPIPLSLDFLEVSSYGASTESSGVVRILKDLANAIEGRDVVVVEDILDTGHTLAHVIEHLRSQHPSSVRLCTLLDKPARRIVPIRIDYRGFEIPDKFVVGYGLDYAERYRNLPFIGVLKPEVYRGEP